MTPCCLVLRDVDVDRYYIVHKARQLYMVLGIDASSRLRYYITRYDVHLMAWFGQDFIG